VPKRISIELTDASIKNGIKELQQYKRWIVEKEAELLSRLASLGATVASIEFSRAIYNGSKDVSVRVDDTGSVAVIYAEGESVAFIEFGAGIYYNNGNAHPYAAEFGYGVGTYPSEHPPNRAIHPGYWWYKGADGAKHLSLGTQASMPIYYASEHMRNNAVARAVEVFGS
jgi:hypothetical protein